MILAIRKERVVLAAEILLVGIAVWFVRPRATLLASIGGGAGVAVLLVGVMWIAATVIELGFYFAVSWDDSADLVFASIRAGAQAVWFVPAIVLLAIPAVEARIVGLLLVANTTRLLLSRNAPNRLGPGGKQIRRPRHRLLLEPIWDRTFARQTFPTIVGALLLQVSILCVGAGRTIMGAGLAMAASALWTRSAIRHGAAERTTQRTPAHWALGLVLTLVLAIFLSAAEVQTRAEMTGGKPGGDVLATVESILHDLEDPPKAKGMLNGASKVAAGAKRAAKTMDGGSGVSLAPGVIVRPAATRAVRLMNIIPRSLMKGAPKVDRPITFAFTGEYKVYPLLSSFRRHGWAMDDGTLIEHVYETAGGGLLETIAEQSIDPPMDFTGAGKVIVLVQNEERGPFSASMELLAGGEPVVLGSQVGGLERREELLEFDIPNGPPLVRAIRMSFDPLRRQRNRSVQVAVREFTIVPKGR